MFILTDNLGYGEIGAGTHSVSFGGVADGLTQWEVTVGEALSDAGYASSNKA